MDDLHSRMLGAVLAGEGLRGVAGMAAAEAGGPVAIVLPARGLAAAEPETDLDRLMEYVAAGGAAGGAPAPQPIALETQVRAGQEVIGSVLLLDGATNGRVPIDREEILHAAAIASLTEAAVVGARDELAEELRGSLLEELRHGRLDADETVRRAARLGCDLGRGAVALVADARQALPDRAAFLVRSEVEGAIAEVIGDRVYAILPARGADDAPERALAAAGRVVRRLRKHAAAVHSSFHPDPAALGRAIREAELMLDVTLQDERLAEQVGAGMADGLYRLLFRALATNPEEVRRFFEDTVAPLVEHDREYRTDLVGTLEAYLANDCNMNATARAIYAHRHTVSHRLDRIRQLTGLDPVATEARERLGLGIKAYRLLAPTLPR